VHRFDSKDTKKRSIMTVIDLATKRQPVTYTLVITHHWDGHFEFTVLDVADDERSQEAVGYALKKAAEAWENISARGNN